MHRPTVCIFPYERLVAIYTYIYIYFNFVISNEFVKYYNRPLGLY